MRTLSDTYTIFSNFSSFASWTFFSIFQAKVQNFNFPQHNTTHEGFWKQHFNKSFLLPFTFFSPAPARVAAISGVVFKLEFQLFLSLFAANSFYFLFFGDFRGAAARINDNAPTRKKTTAIIARYY